MMYRPAMIFTIGRTVYAVSQWLVVAYLARFVSKEELGLYTYAMAFCAPIIMFSQMNMRLLLVTDGKNQFNTSDYVAARLVNVVIALVIIVLASFFIAERNQFLVILAVALFKSIESISDIYLGVLQKHHKIGVLALSNIIRGVSLLVMVIVLLLAGLSLEAALFGVAAIWGWVTIFHDIRRALKVESISVIPSLECVNIYSVIKKSVPLGLVMSLIALNMSIPVYLIEMNIGIESVGVYSAVVYFIILGKIVTDSFIQTSSKEMASSYLKNDFSSVRRMLQKLLSINLVIGLAACLVAFLVGEHVLSILYGAGFSSHVDVLKVIVIAGLINYLSQVFSVLITIKRRLGRMVLIHFIQVTAVFLSGLIMVDSYGVIGAAISLMIGYAIVLCLNIVLLIIDGDIRKIFFYEKS